MHVISYDIHVIVLSSYAAVISSHPMSSTICIKIVSMRELYSIIFLELLMYFCYNTSYIQCIHVFNKHISSTRKDKGSI